MKRTPSNSAVNHSGCSPLHWYRRNEKSRISHGFLEFTDPVHLSGRHACAHSFRGPCLGNYHFNGITRRFLPFLHLVIRQNLQGRNPDVREESHLERII